MSSFWSKLVSPSRMVGASRPKHTEEQEPRSGMRTPLSPMRINAIEHAADAGQLRLAADLCHALMGDGRVQAALSQRIGGLLSLPMHWEPGSKRSAKALKAIQDDFFEGLQESALSQLYSWGLTLGVGIGELLWRVGERGRLIPSLKVWDPRWLSFDFEEDAWKVETAGGTKTTVTPGDGHWVLHTPKGGRAPWQHGVWRALNKPFFVKDDGSLGWARYNEVHGSPIRAFTGTPGMMQRQLDAIADDLDTSKGFTSIALPNGSTLSLVEATGNTWESFREALAWASTEISIAILGQNLTTEVEGGSLAASRTHRDVESMLIASDAEVESTFLREQVLSWWARYNFGDISVTPWPKRETEAPEDLASKAGTLKTCGEAVSALQLAGFPLDLEALAEEFGLPLMAGVEVGKAKEGPKDEPDEPEDDSKAPPANRAAPSRGPRMAAKAPEEALPPGADRGFDHLDALAVRAEAASRELIEAQESALFDIVEAATSPEDLEERLQAAFVDLESGELNAILERALILADLSGRFSGIEDL